LEVGRFELTETDSLRLREVPVDSEGITGPWFSDG
jgi:hypothetical protein